MQKSRNSPPLPPPSSSSYSLTAATDFGFGQKASPSFLRQLAEEWRESEEMAKGQTDRQTEREVVGSLIGWIEGTNVQRVASE